MSKLNEEFQNQKVLISNLIHIILWVLLSTGQKDSPFIIEGKATTSSSYCGGAPPDSDLMERLQRERPYAGQWFYLKEGTENRFDAPIIDSALSDTSGFFRFHVDTGNYVIISAQMLDPNLANNYISGDIQSDPECLLKWQTNGLAQITVQDSSITNLHFHFSERCFLPIGIPCLYYTGPLPP